MPTETYTFEKVADGIAGCEGPIVDLQGRLFVVCPPQGKILQIDPVTGHKKEHADTGGAPAGLQVDAENGLWVADMQRGILRIAPEGQVHDRVREYAGQPIRGCNDCALDRHGNLYFTAPAGSSDQTPVGEVFCRLATGPVQRLDQGYAFCNGIAIRQDQRQLVVAETHSKSLWAYHLDAPGRVRNRTLFARLPGDDDGGPDGLDFDGAGHLLVAHWKGASIDVFNPQGSLVERIGTPFDRPTNLHLGGQDGRTLYISAGGTENALWRTRWRYAGAGR